VKDSSGRHVAGAGRLVAFMVVGAAIGIGAILYGLAQAPRAVALIALGVVCLLCVGFLAVAIAVTQWRRRGLSPSDDAGAPPHESRPEQSPRWQLPIPLLVALVVWWAVFLVITVVNARWVGVAANGLLLAASGYSLVHALRRRRTQ
jgi:hypothetical protein